MRVVDSSNFDISYSLCVLQKDIPLCNDFSNLYEFLLIVNKTVCQPFGLSNKIHKEAELKKICVEFLEDKDLWRFGRRLLEGRFFPRSNHFITRYVMCRIAQALNLSLDFRQYLADPFVGENHKMFSNYALPTAKTEFPTLPDASVEIEGYRFLSYENYLVLSNGGLIEYEMIVPSLKKHIARGLPVAEFTVPKDIASNYIFNKNKPLSTLDGLPFSERVSLVCLDIDYLTELPLTDEFLKFKASHPIPDIAQDYPQISNLSRFRRLIQYANIVVDRMILDSGAQILSGSKLFFITQGGTGSGKSSLMRYIESKSREDFLVLSLDQCRSYCKLMDFYVKCHHHSDDYKPLEYLCRIILETALKKAISMGLNIVFDSTGIPYMGRLKTLANEVKGLGYTVSLLSASAPLSTERDRKDMDSSIFARIMRRLRKKKRAVPWNIVIAKHVGHPSAFLESIEDINLSEILIYDTMQKKGDTKLLGKVFDISLEEAQKIEYAKTIDEQYLLSVLSKTLKYDFSNVDIKTLYCLFYEVDGGVRLLVIFNKIKFIDLLQKAAFNTDARNYEELEYNKFLYHMPMLDYVGYDRGEKNNYIIRTQKLL